MDITTIIAIYGATLGTLSFILSVVLGIIEIRKQRPRLVVTAKIGKIYDNTMSASEPLIILKAVNLGKGSILINGVGLYLRDGSKLLLVSPYLLSLPHEVHEQRECTTYVSCRFFKEHKDNKEIQGIYFQDVTGKLWKNRIKRKERYLWLNATDKGWEINKRL